MHSVICPSPVRTRRRRFALGLAGAALVSGFSWRAAAQSEAEVPAPNVLLLVDSSGSMEFQTDGSFPNCVPGDETIQEKSRWINLVEVLTGTINHYSCWGQDRSSADFRSEFTLDTSTPYDFGYVNPYHRALSNLCAYGPGVLPSPNVFLWPDKAVNTFEFLGSGLSRPAAGLLPTFAGCPAGFSQVEDGLLDIYKGQVRFGLMTFDARVSPGKGYTGTSADYPTGMDGNWSYYPSGSKAQGHPANCSYEVDQEVGARNAAAPPWEGRLIGFGAPNLTNFAERNGWIQQTLLSTRPYGATPINGQLYDARDFLWNDTSPDPFDGTQSFGPKSDPNWQATDCRKTIMILLTDGEPNLDLRPYCEMRPPAPETPGRCPYEEPPEKVVELLRTAPPLASQSVETFVVGFALGSVDPYPAGGAVTCDLMPDSACTDPNNNDFDNYPAGKAVQACCTLNKIAAAGSLDADGIPRKAFFADDADELRGIFTTILNGVIRAATRTMPVFSAGGDSSNKGFKFSASFETESINPSGGLWRGQLDRHRFKCDDDLIAKAQTLSASDGDNFGTNLNNNGGDRRFYTVIADTDNRNSIRPELATDPDGLGVAGGTTVYADQPTALAPLIPATAMQLTTSSCPGFSAAECRDHVVEHLVGLTNGAGESRCFGGVCELFGAIVHSTPTLVTGKPSDLLRDESYDAFVRLMATEARPTVLYTSTVDGFLHAFNVAPFPGSADAADNEVKNGNNNEYWAFIPPGVLPVLRAQYPNTPAILLDGTPIIKDVVARTSGLSTRFERQAADALTGSGLWRTVLTQSFGESLVDGGYFALDITQPDREPGHAPKFLWQLTRDTAGTRLFGNGGTPLITTVFLQDGVGGAREVAVAVLPGGSLEPDNSTLIALDPSLPKLEVQGTSFDSIRTQGRNFTSSERARSLTIVRLDTGEVVRTFRPAALGFSTSVFTSTIIPAPISGQPKAFPDNTGAVADRIFVGDADGRLWRVDVSSQNPAQWEMSVFFDAFYDNVAGGSQPVLLPPVLSTDDDGAVTVAFATGDQQATAAPTTMVNRIASLTEKFNSSTNKFEAKLNWVHSLDQGFRVTGPMQLFNKALYYAASKPPDSTGTTCNRGSAQVFAAHYLESRTPNSPTSGPANAKESQPALAIGTHDLGMVFGVNLQADPVCKSAEEVISGDDSFGYGSISMSREVNPGKYYLTYQVSGTTVPTDGSGDSSTRNGITAVSLEVPRPRIPVTFDSWALIYE